MKYYLGIDPGGSGATVLVNEEGSLCGAILNSDTEHSYAQAVGRWNESHEIIQAAIEVVHSMPGQGVASSFKFGMSYGFLRGVLVTLQIPFVSVQPNAWQKEIGCLWPKGKPKPTKTQKKNYNKATAERLWPKYPFTHATADAAMIAEYARRKGIR